MAHDVTGMVVDHTHQIHRIHPLKVEGKYVDLPQGVRDLFLKTPALRTPAVLLNRRVAKSRIIDHPANRLGAHSDSLAMAKLVTDPSDSRIGIVTTHLFDTFFKITADFTAPWMDGLTGQRPLTAFLVQLAPFTKGRVADTDQITHFR
jgi:hypothetical protein